MRLHLKTALYEKSIILQDKSYLQFFHPLWRSKDGGVYLSDQGIRRVSDVLSQDIFVCRNALRHSHAKKDITGTLHAQNQEDRDT